MFYTATLSALLQQGILHRDDRILVVCGGHADRDALASLGFTNAVISNLDTTVPPDEMQPYQWDHQDAEALTAADASFDVVLVHDGLHHCRSPHRALLEMYRVARKAIVVFESRDSLLMRLAAPLGFAAEYEIEAVASQGGISGGVANGPVPNYVYRWTEREVRKTIQSFRPEGPHQFRFFYGFRYPEGRLSAAGHFYRRIVARMLFVFVSAFLFLFKKQRNAFAFAVIKPAANFPWLQATPGGLKLTDRWLQDRTPQ